MVTFRHFFRKHDDFYYTVRTVVILQLASGSCTGILALFFIVLVSLLVAPACIIIVWRWKTEILHNLYFYPF